MNMFDSVTNALESCGVCIDEGGLLLLSETSSTTACGLVCHVITSELANNHHVCFVSMQHTWGHYCNIGNKLGVNLRQLTSDGKIQVIEMLKLLSRTLDEVTDSADDPFDFIKTPSVHPLHKLYQLIRRTLQPWLDKNEFFILVLDGISFLLNLGLKSADIHNFINYCRNLTEMGDLSGRYAGTLVVVTQLYEKDDETSIVSSKIIHTSNTYISLDSLKTGLSREVHGNFIINVLNRKLPHICSPEVWTFQYKMEDKNMKLFAPGTASGVL
ncbi:hypothetical protein SK128_011066 [Halocaridina rubra]|uniref:Elongator complex protein 6 n=1 Tax=Halocaridina rubra TaxID=373956 RepID=A0AAN9A492_HALRR